MAETPVVPEDPVDEVKQVNSNSSDPKNMSLEALSLLLLTSRLHYLQEQTKREFLELKDRQEKVAELHKVLKAINNSTAKEGSLDITQNEELKSLIKRAKELGVNVTEDKMKYTKEERDRLIENVRMSIEDFNVKNDMQLQTVTRLTNERYESFQMARSIMKPLHDDKINKARAIGGR